MDPQRKAPREQRRLTLHIDGKPSHVVDVSAVGLRVMSPREWPLDTTLTPAVTFEDGRCARIKVKVVWANKSAGANQVELGLELVEASRDYFDQLGPISFH